MAAGIPFLIISNMFSNIIRAEGNPKKAMFGMIIGNLLNIVLDPVMILVLGWNVAGAAIATVAGNVFATVFYVIHLFFLDHIILRLFQVFILQPMKTTIALDLSDFLVNLRILCCLII